MKKSTAILILLGFAVILFLILVALSILGFNPANDSLSNKPLPDEVSLDYNTKIFSPFAGEQVSLPFFVYGEARGHITITLTNSAGQIIYENTQILADNSDLNFFSHEIKYLYGDPSGGPLTLNIASDWPEKNNQPLELNDTATFSLAGDTYTLINLYYNNSDLDETASCTAVFPVVRAVPSVSAIGQAAVSLLLQNDLTRAEQANGYLSSLPPNVTLQSLSIEKNIAHADFSEELDRGVGGSCRVAAIRSQISETLKQFPTIDEVVLSINGNTEEILQP